MTQPKLPKWLESAAALALLALAAWIAFGGVAQNGFVNWDDEKNFLANPHFRGLGREQVRWALTTLWLGVFQPLGWLLLEVQYQLWGLAPKGYHLVSLFFHVVSGFLLFQVIRRLLGEGSFGPALAAAVLFCVHPLRVEVVAWASCQPYLPSACFGLLSVLFFLRFRERRDRTAWLGSWLCLVAALLCKAIAIGLPIALWALDFSLRKPKEGKPSRWALAPHFATAGAALAMALLARDSIDDPMLLDRFGWSSRVAQAAYGLHFPVLKSLLPEPLAAFYPLPENLHFHRWPYAGWLVSLACLVLGSALGWRRWPGLAAGLVAYLAFLFPTLGLMRYSDSLTADRYAYVPSMVLAVGVAYWLRKAAAWLNRPGRLEARTGLPLLLAAAALQLILMSRTLTASWRESQTLWSHAVENGAAKSPEVHNNLAIALDEKGERQRALSELDRALELNPDYVEAHMNRGIHLAKAGRLDEAEKAFEQAISLAPLHADAFNNLGFAYLQRGKIQQARYALEEALRLDPQSANSHNNLGVAYSKSKEAADRVKMLEHFRAAYRLDPLNVAAKQNLALSLAEDGQDQEAERLFRDVLSLQPDHPEAAHQLKSLLARRAASVK